MLLLHGLVATSAYMSVATVEDSENELPTKISRCQAKTGIETQAEEMLAKSTRRFGSLSRPLRY